MTGRIVDVNVHLSRWPTRRLPLDETPALTARLRTHGIVEAWAGSFDALMHRDVAALNARLARECAAERGVRLVPFGTVNPLLPDWEDDLRRCSEVHHMPGIRLYPNYHRYALDHPALARLLALAAARRLVVTLVLHMEDERMMNPLWRVPPVDPAPLEGLVARTAGLRLVLLNALNVLQPAPLSKILRAGEVYVEIATLEGVGGLARLLETIPVERVLFGSHAPFFYVESALLKLDESPLPGTQAQAVRVRNARRLIAAGT